MNHVVSRADAAVGGRSPDGGRRRLFVAALGLMLPVAAQRVWAVGGAPPAPLQGWLQEAGVPAAQVGAMVEPLDGGAPLLAWQAGRPFNPASAMKLLTSFAALGMLGPDYRWRTGAWLRGALAGDILLGDLVLRGGGDPKLVIEDLTAFVQRMRGQGVRELRGDLVIDDALFDAGATADDPLDGDASQPYNVGPHPLLMNFKAARVLLRPAAGGELVIALDPPLADVRIDNAVRLVPGACRHPAWGVSVRDGPGVMPGDVASLRVSGSFSAGCGEQGVFAAMLGHRDFIHAVFKAAWEASGGVFAGRTRVQRGAAVGSPWLEWISPRTLTDVVRDINKFSNNVMSRNLLLQMGAERVARAGGGTRPGLDVAREALVGWLAARGLRFPELVVDNGSGLSRAERIAPASLAALLRHAAASPWGDLLRESLPVVGFDGTMRHRLAGESVAGRAWIKTGSLSEVRSIAGYVDAASGRRHVVVLVANGPAASASASARVQDRLLRWVHAHG